MRCEGLPTRPCRSVHADARGAGAGRRGAPALPRRAPRCSAAWPGHRSAGRHSHLSAPWPGHLNGARLRRRGVIRLRDSKPHRAHHDGASRCVDVRDDHRREQQRPADPGPRLWAGLRSSPGRTGPPPERVLATLCPGDHPSHGAEHVPGDGCGDVPRVLDERRQGKSALHAGRLHAGSACRELPSDHGQRESLSARASTRPGHRHAIEPRPHSAAAPPELGRRATTTGMPPRKGGAVRDAASLGSVPCRH